jgi:ABC-type cobalamin/Fe3+-siderophores transport system ATPase subunit/uncharacterized protein (DUF2267 family)
MITTKYKLTLPKPNTDGLIFSIFESNQSVLLIGANGSGKTRLGTWIETNSPEKHLVHRISAQRSLAMPESSTPMSIARAGKDLLFGYAEANDNDQQHHKNHYKWQGKPAITQQNDFQKLMVYLFSEEAEVNAIYIAKQKLSTSKVELSKTKLDLIKELWEQILPHRELKIGGFRIQTLIRGNDDSIYSSIEMSDGERVIFYLIGQCLAAPENGIIVIDEPELHLHKSVQSILWNEIEKLREDCLFVYLTHDVDFAASKEGAKRIWLKSFNGTVWDWEEIQKDSNLPDDLLMEIFGNRKPVVFVEGENGKNDVSLYRALLPAFLVIPRGSCTQVIQSVKALKANQQLHHLKIYGIIDRDRRVENEIQALERDDIFVLKVAEVENLFCTKEILEIVSNRQTRDAEADFTNASQAVFSYLKAELENQISLQVLSEIKFQLNKFPENLIGINTIKETMITHVNGINIEAIYEDIKKKFELAIAEKNYDQILELYNRKSLAKRLSAALGLLDGELENTVIRLARSESQSEICSALKKYFGNFSRYMT